MNPINLQNFKKYFELGVWGLETTFWPLGPRRHVSSHKFRTLAQISQAGPHFLKSHEMNSIKLLNLKKFLDLGTWDREFLTF